MKKTFLLLITAVFFSACGGDSGVGQIALQVENARGPAGIESSAALTLTTSSIVIKNLTEVTQFKLTISGEGIETPMVATAEASATQISLMDIPAGRERIILIEAFNKDGTVIRRRKIDGVEISPGVVTPIKTSLNTIPIALNLRDGSVASLKNFRVEGFGEPGSSIRLETNSSAMTGKTISLNESASETPVIVSPSVSTGLFEFSSSQLPLGKQTITLLDESTGESSSFTIYVVEDNARPGRQIISGGRLGPAVTIGTGLGGDRVGNFPLVLRALKETSKGKL